MAGLGARRTALAATRSKDGYLAAQYARLGPRRGHTKALGAVRHSIIVPAGTLLSTGEILSGGRATAEAIPGAELVIIEGMGTTCPVLWPQITSRITTLVHHVEAATVRDCRSMV